jgi:hypothetical protein
VSSLHSRFKPIGLKISLAQLYPRQFKMRDGNGVTIFHISNYTTFDSGVRHWQTFRAMPRKKDPEKMTAREQIADILQWAERQQFRNIAASLRRVLALLDRENEGRS